jgi:hypothetical protein
VRGSDDHSDFFVSLYGSVAFYAMSSGLQVFSSQ